MSATETLDAVRPAAKASRRMRAWCRALDAVAEMRSALDWRIALEDPADTHLESDVQTFCELALALTDFMKARRE